MSIGATHEQALTPAAPTGAVIHPLWVRVTHWVNAVAMVIMIGSGWEIYNASPLFAFLFPRGITLGGWLAGALLWHFAQARSPGSTTAYVLFGLSLAFMTLLFVTVLGLPIPVWPAWT